MNELERLRVMIDEENYPYFSDVELSEKISRLNGRPLEQLAKELCIIKSGIQEIKLGDITIPSPKEHFINLASGLRQNRSGTMVRADERE